MFYVVSNQTNTNDRQWNFYFISFSHTNHENCNTVQCILANGRVGLEIRINKIVGMWNKLGNKKLVFYSFLTLSFLT
jgi:hypothetical protein